MFLTLLKRVVKAALHDAVESWATETGLPRAVVEEMRAQRLALAAQAETTADAQAALALGVEDDEEERPTLPMISAARVTSADADECPPPGDEPALLHWIDGRRERQVAWADIAKVAAGAGHTVTEEALRMRYRRWRERGDQPNGDPPTAA